MNVGHCLAVPIMDSFMRKNQSHQYASNADRSCQELYQPKYLFASFRVVEFKFKRQGIQPKGLSLTPASIVRNIRTPEAGVADATPRDGSIAVPPLALSDVMRPAQSLPRRSHIRPRWIAAAAASLLLIAQLLLHWRFPPSGRTTPQPNWAPKQPGTTFGKPGGAAAAASAAGAAAPGSA